MSEIPSKLVAEILKNSNTPKKHIFDRSTAFLKQYIFGNKNLYGRLCGGSKNVFGGEVWGQVPELVKNDASIIHTNYILV